MFSTIFRNSSNIGWKYTILRQFTTFKTAVPKSVRSGENKYSARNIKKNYLHQKGKSHSSTIWLDRQLRDPYTIMAKEDGYRSRAVYKLKEIDEKFHIFRNGDLVVDVGAAPGGWSQYAVERVGITIPHSVFSIDLLDMAPISGVHFLCGDFLSESVRYKLEDYIDNRKVDVVISDIAPNFSGDHSIDHEKQIDMCESVLEFSKRVAKRDCSIVLKILQGEEFPSFMESARSQFRSVNLIKPKASRKKSTEIYCVLKHFLWSV